MLIQQSNQELVKQDYWMSYMNEIQYLTKSLLQDYEISYMDEIQYLAKSLFRITRYHI